MTTPLMTTPLMTKLLPTAIISQTQGQISSELSGEAVILNLDSGVYYGLNEVGARIWELTQQPCSFESILQTLLAEYEVPAEACEQDLIQVLTELQAAQLIEIRHEAP